MFSVPYAKMVCDSSRGDGNLDFYDEYCEWINRGTGDSFKVYYKDIDDVRIVSGLKKTVIVVLKNGLNIRFYLYKAATLKEMLYKAVQRVNGEGKEEVKEEKPAQQGSEDCLAKLERLAKLHDSGALTDEEFAEAKQKVLKGE